GQVAPPIDPATKTVTAGTVRGEFSSTSTGAATYGVAFTSVPGRGVEPQLGLVYDSEGGGGGVLGSGFSLTGVSAITRCPSNLAVDEDIRGVRFDADDKLCLAGRRLVPVNEAPGVVEYATRPDAFVKVVGHFPVDAKD